MSLEQIVKNQRVVDDKALKVGSITPRRLTYESGRIVCVRLRTHKRHGKSIKRGLPVDTLIYREMAARNLDLLLGWKLTPETVFGTYMGKEAVFVAWQEGVNLRNSYPNLFHYKPLTRKATVRRVCRELGLDKLVQLALFYFVSGARDAHSKNILITNPKLRKRPWALDNECAFGLALSHYYSIIHKAFFWDQLNIPDSYREDLIRIADGVGLRAALSGLISDEALLHVKLRAKLLLELGANSLGYANLSKEGKFEKELFPNLGWYFGVTDNFQQEVPQETLPSVTGFPV